jgi:hypothetical protein
MSEDLIQRMKLIINSYNYPVITPPPSPEPPVILKPIHEEWNIIMHNKLESDILNDLINESNRNKLSADAKEWTPTVPIVPILITPLPPILSSIQLKVYNIFKFNNFPINLNINYIMKIIGISHGFKFGFLGSLVINNIFILESNCKYIKLNYFSIPN